MKTQTEQNTSDISKLNKPSFRQDIFHPSRLLYMLIFMGIFVLVGQGVPDIYYRYFDKTEYFKVVQPVVVDKNTYEPGEKVTVTLVRTVQYPANVHGVIELILVDAQGSYIKRTLKTADFNIDTSTEQVIHTSYELPTDIPNGPYFLKAVLTYQIRGLDKTYVWQTESFKVEKEISKE